MKDSQEVGVNTVEELVRATLADPRRRIDPPAGHHQRIEERIRVARRRRTFRSVGVFVGVVVLLGAGGLVAGHRPGTGARRAAPAASPPGYGALSRQQVVGSGTPVSVVACGDAFCLIESAPDTLLRLDPSTLRVTAVAPLPGTPRGIAVDPTDGRVWVWYSTPTGQRAVGEYDPMDLPEARKVQVPATEIFAGTAVDGELWLGTDQGLYHVGASDPVARPVPGFDQQVFGLTADVSGDRILVDELVASGGVRPVSVPVHGSPGSRGAVLPIGKEEIVVVAGQIWVGGYGDAGPPKLVRLNPQTLQPVATSPVDAEVGPGVIVWAGVSVLWVRNGGDEGLSCVDPINGGILQQWGSVQGPVASLPGTAVAVDGAFLVKPVLAGSCRG